MHAAPRCTQAMNMNAVSAACTGSCAEMWPYVRSPMHPLCNMHHKYVIEALHSTVEAALASLVCRAVLCIVSADKSTRALRCTNLYLCDVTLCLCNAS